MMTFRDVTLHENDTDLTYHVSVKTPQIVPLVLDFNDEAVLGRARLKWDSTRTYLLADLYLDNNQDNLADPLVAIPATDGTTIFESDSGTHYAMEGQITLVSILTWAAAIKLWESQEQNEEEVA